jgi:hypothetical protein
MGCLKVSRMVSNPSKNLTSIATSDLHSTPSEMLEDYEVDVFVSKMDFTIYVFPGPQVY